MNTAMLEKYGISFEKQGNGNISITANSRNLDNYLYMFVQKPGVLANFIAAIDLALQDNYNSIPYDDREATMEVGFQLFTGIIQPDMTFDLFLEDHYEATLETLPLADVREILHSLQEFVSKAK